MSRNMYSFIAALALGCASLTSHAQSALSYHLTFIGGRLPFEAEPLVITNLNDKGEVVGSRPSSDAGVSAFVWREGIFEDLRPPLGNPPSSGILGSNDKSAMIGWYEDERNNPDTLHHFLLNRGKVTLIETPPPLLLFSAYDINDRGQVVLSATNGEFGPYQYFIWQRGQLSPALEELPGAEGGQHDRLCVERSRARGRNRVLPGQLGSGALEGRQGHAARSACRCSGGNYGNAQQRGRRHRRRCATNAFAGFLLA